MEARLGAALTRRHDRGVEPITFGEVLLRHLGPLFDLLDRAFADVEAFAAGARGHVRLHAIISAVPGFLPEALAGFLAVNLDVEVSPEERFTADMLHAVRTGAADLRLGSGTVRDVPPELELFPWREDRLVALLPADHPLAARSGKLRFADPRPSPSSGYRRQWRCSRSTGARRLAIGLMLRERVNVASFDGVRRMVEVGLGVAILPDTGVEPHAAGMTIAVRSLDEPWAVRPLMLCVRCDPDALPAAARILAAHLLARQRFS